MKSGRYNQSAMLLFQIIWSRSSPNLTWRRVSTWGRSCSRWAGRTSCRRRCRVTRARCGHCFCLKSHMVHLSMYILLIVLFLVKGFFYCHIACVKFNAELAFLSWKLQWKCSFTLNVVMCCGSDASPFLLWVRWKLSKAQLFKLQPIKSCKERGGGVSRWTWCFTSFSRLEWWTTNLVSLTCLLLL